MLKKTLALLLTLCMVFSLVPVNVFAEETELSANQQKYGVAAGYIMDNGLTQIHSVPAESVTNGLASIDGYLTSDDPWYTYGEIGTYSYVSMSDSKYPSRMEMAKQLLSVQNNTFYFAQDADYYYIAVKAEQRSINHNGYNYYVPRQNIDLRFGFNGDDYTDYAQFRIWTRDSYGATGTTATVYENGKSTGETIANFLPNKGKGFATYTEPGYNKDSQSISFNRDIATTVKNIGEKAGGINASAASVYVGEFAISKAAVIKKYGVAPSSIFFGASASVYFASHNDLTITHMGGTETLNSQINVFQMPEATKSEHKTALTNAIKSVDKTDTRATTAITYGTAAGTAKQFSLPSMIVFEAPAHKASDENATHEWEDNPIDAYLKTGATCTTTATYYKSCGVCGKANKDATFETPALGHSYTVKGDVVSSTVTACNAENPSRITYKYKCAGCDDTKELPWGDYNHNFVKGSKAIDKTTTTNKTTGITTTTRPERYIFTCSDCSKVITKVNCTSHNFVQNTATGKLTDATCVAPATYIFRCTSVLLSEEGCTTTECPAIEIRSVGQVNPDNHTSLVTVPAKDATCTETGLKAGQKCEACGTVTVKQETIAALGHVSGTAVKENVVAATCGKAGSYDEVVYCTECNTELSRKTVAVDATGNHSWNEGVETTAPACTTKGEKTFECKVCKTTKTEAIDALGHTEVVDAAKAATCTETGLTEGKHCSVCNEVLVAQTVVPATGHNYSTKVTAPTCTEEGYTTYSCACGDTYKGDTVPATGHNYDEGKITTAPTCTETGVTTFTCTCGHTKTETIVAKGHAYASVVTAPTCTEKGYTTHTCNNCGNSYTDSETDMIAHSFGAWSVTTKPTCTVAGEETRTCTVCKTATEKQAVAALGHKYNAVVTAPTFDAQGYTTYTCSVCGDSYKDNYVDAKVAVATINGVKYATLQDAIFAAQSGDTVKLLSDIVVDSVYNISSNMTAGIRIANDKKLTIDLNGKTISQTLAQDLNHYIILNRGELTIKDSVGGGKIVYASIGETTYGSGAVFNTGTLTIEGGTFENLSTMTGASQSYANAVYNMCGTGIGNNATLTIKGGTFISAGSSPAIQLRCLNETYTNVTKISGGTFVNGVRMDIAPNAATNGAKYLGNLEITGGTFELVDNGNAYSVRVNSLGGDTSGVTVSITGGVFEGEVELNQSSESFNDKFITGGTFASDVTENCADGYKAVANEDGTYSVVAVTYVAQIGDAKYETLEEAIKAASEGATIKLINDVELSASLVVAADKKITLDLNGKVLSMTDASGKTVALIMNNGTLTIKDSAGNGKISFSTTTPSMDNAYASNAISNYGTIVIESGIIENTSATGSACYALDNYAGSVATIKGGKLSAVKTAVRIFNWTNGDAAKATLNIYDGEIISGSGYAVNVNSGNTPVVEINITGGTITTNDTVYNLAVYIINKGSAENLTVNVSGGTFNGIFALNGVTATTMKDGAVSITGGTFEGVTCYADPAYGFVSGGTFASDVTEYCAKNYRAVENNGTYTVEYYVVVDKTEDETVSDEIVETIVGNINNKVEKPEITENKTAVENAKTELKAAVEAAGGTFDENSVTTEVSIKLAELKVANGKAKVITFKVTPQVVHGNYTQKLDNNDITTEITFRLPVGEGTETKAKVYHNGELIGEYAVQGTGADRFVEISSKTFSEYAVELVDAIDAVAQVGETKYATIAEAVAAVKENGGTLVLLDNINESITFNYPDEGAPTEITIDLNGFTITSAESTVWVSDGYVVTIKDSSEAKTGKIISTNAGGEAIAITRNGNVILQSGYVYNDFCAVWLYNATENGSFVMNGGTLEVPNGGQTISVGAGKAIINGGKVLCNKIPVTGGGWNILVYEAGALEITGGEFLGTIGSNGGPVSISGGTFTYCDDPNDGFNQAHLADGYNSKTNEDGSVTVYALPTSLQGTGTKEDPFLINNYDDLVFFRNSVNNGNRYNGQFVKLTADIDLNDEEWTPIGDRNVDQGSFLGTFDGDNHTISNLWISEWTKTGAGFFSKVGMQTEYVSGTVKNVIFNNVTIVSNESYVGVIAQAPSGALIENVHITGDVTISGYGYVGGIVGHGYPTINNCSVKSDEGTITANYWGAGAILGFAGDYGAKINNATVEGVNIHANYGGAASVAGSPYGADVDKAEVSDVEITSNSDYCMSYIAGGGKVSNITMENVTATANGEPITPGDAVASVNGTIYFDFAEAIAAATAGDTVKILADVTVTEKFDLTGVNLDLNGKTLYLNATGNYIVDTVTISNGTIDISGADTTSPNTCFTVGGQWAKAGSVLNLNNVKLVGEDYSTGWAVICVHNGTSLNMDGCTVELENDNGTQGGFIKDTSGVNNTANINITNSDITLANVDRGFTGGKVTLNTVELTITGGEHGINGSELTIVDSTVSISDGTGRGITLNKFNASIENSTVTLSNMGEGGIRFKTANELTVDADSTLAATSAHADVAGATVNGVAVTGTEDDMSAVTVENGTTTVENPYYEAEVNGVKYDSLQTAIDAAQSGETITLLTNVAINTTLKVPTDKTITINGNNYKITPAADFAADGNGAALVLSASDSAYSASNVYTIKNLTFEGFDGVTRVLRANFCDAVIENCVFVDNNTTEGVITTAYANLTIDGCEFNNNTVGFAVINAGFDNSTYTDLKVNIKNNTFENNKANIAVMYLVSSATVSGNYFAGNEHTGDNANASAVLAGPYYAGDYTVEIKENIFVNAMKKGDTVLPDVFAEGWDDANTSFDLNNNYWNGAESAYATSGNPQIELDHYYASYENGELGDLTEIKTYVAQIGDVKYDSLQAAIDAAQSGETVTLLEDIALTEGISIASSKEITLDLNGKKITGADTVNLDIYGKLTIDDTIGGGVSTFRNHFVRNGGELVVNGGTLQNIATLDAGFVINAYDGNGKVTINGGTVQAVNDSNYAIYISATSTLTVNGGTVQGRRGAISNSGEVVINDGTIKVTDDIGGHCVYLTDNATLTVEKAEFVVDSAVASYCVYVNGNNATATIKGGKFTAGTYKCMLGIASTVSGSKIVVSGGTFNVDPTAYLADGYVALPDLNGSYVVGKKPTATVNNLGQTTISAGDYMVYGNGDDTADMPLSFVMQFLADQNAEDMANSPYAEWYGDFVITFTGIENGSFTADGCYLAGHYGSFGWVKVPVDGMTIEEGARYPVMLGVGMGQKYDYICSSVQDFKCALYLTPEILEANPNLQVKLELAVVDNSQGEDAAASALVNNENVYSVTDYEYEAEDFVVKYEAQIGETKYETLAEAIAAAQTGDTIVLLADVELADTLIIDKVGALTIDGNGKKITLADSFTNTNSWGAAIMLGNSNYGDADAANHTVTIKNVTFDGITGNSLFRTQGVTFTMDGCTVVNCDSTATVQGLMRLDATVATINNTTFEGNKASKIIGHNHNTSGSACKAVIDNCEFNANTITGNGVIVLSSDAGCTIKDSEFVGNNVTCTNGATVYMGFSENNVVTGNLFEENTVTGNATSNRIAGALFVGWENEISGNAFINNTATNASGSAANDVCIDTIYANPAYGREIDIDISENYFNGEKPVEGDHYTVNSKVESAYSLTNYYTSYTTDENGDVVLSGLKKMPAGKVAYRAYINDSASREAIQVDLINVFAENSFVIELYDANGNLLTTTTLKAGAVDAANYTANIVLSGSASGSWDTVIEAEKLTVANAPATIKVYADGTLVDTYTNAFGAGTNVDQTSNYKALDCVYKEAKIGTTYYMTLAEAFAAAQTGDTIVLLADVEISETLKVTDGKAITLDLNGKTITGTDTTSKNFGLIDVIKSTLTVNDSSDAETGKITLTATTNSGWNRYSAVIANTQGTLTINGGHIEHLGGTDMAYAVDTLTNGGIGDATTTVNGGTIKSTYRAMRQFANSTTCTNTLTINGGTIEGTNKGVWLQGSNANANKAALTIDGTAQVNSVYLWSGDGANAASEFTFAADADRVGEVINGLPESYDVKAVDGTYGIVEVVAKIGDNSYETLAEALAALAADDTLELLADVTIDTTITVTANLTIDGNGHTLTYTGADRAIDVRKETNGANLTIKDLTVDCTASYCERGINYNTIGTLTLEGVTVKGDNVTYAVNLPGSSVGATVVINNSDISGRIALNVWGKDATVTATDSKFTSIDTVEAENYAAIKINNNGTTAAEGATITINGGSVTALDENGQPSSAATNATATGTITISDTTVVNGRIDIIVAIVAYEGYDQFYGCFSLQDAITTATGEANATVKLLKDITLTETVTVNGAVKLDLNGKTITGEIVITAADAVLTAPEGLTVTTSVADKIVAYVDGAYELVDDNYVAQIGNVFYASFDEAIAAAKSGDTITLLADHSVATFILNSGITLDLNGHTFEVTTAFVSFGNVIDGTEGGNGLLKISNDVAASHTYLQAGNTFMPIYDTTVSGYRFYKYELVLLNKAGDTADQTKFGVRVTFTNADAYDVIVDTTATELEIAVVLNISGRDNPFVWTYKAKTFKDYADAVATQVDAGETVTKAMTVTISGLSNLAEGTTVSASAAITSSTSMKVTTEPVSIVAVDATVSE